MEMPAFSVSTVELPVGDLERAKAWYRDALGFESEWSDQHHALLSRKGEALRLLLVETADAARLCIRSTTKVLHGVIDLGTPDLEWLHVHLRSMGCKVDELGPPAHAWAPRGFGFFDSEGNRLGAFSSP